MIRRRYGTGSINSQGGRFRARIRTDDGKRIDLGYYSSWEEAEDVLAATRAELTDIRWTTPGGITLRSFGEAWLDRREADNIHRSAHKDRSRWKVHIETAPFIDEPIKSINAQEIRRWIESLLKKPVGQKPENNKPGRNKNKCRTLSRSTILHAKNLLSSCLESAVQDGLITENPARAVKVPKIPNTKEGWTYLKIDEIDQVLMCDRISEEQRVIFTVAIFTGLRKGELWGLRWDDVHLEDDRPEIVVRYSNNGPTKSGKVRRVPLLPRAYEVLMQWRSWSGKGSLWVFPTKAGKQRNEHDDAGWRDKPYRVNGVRKVIEGAKKKAGIKRPVRFHDFRHTCASHLVMGTWGRAWTLEEVKEFLGHAGIQMTQRYAHLSPESLHKAAAETVISTTKIGPKLAPNTGARPSAYLRNPPKSFSTPGQIRTVDLRLRKPLLYPAELREHGPLLVGLRQSV